MVGMMGLKNPKIISDKEIIKYSNKFNIPLTDSYKLDTAYYSYLFSLDTTKYKTEIHDHYQPLQALYYHDDDFVSFQINCNTGGFSKLDWNRDGIFETFPPKFQNPIDSIFTIEQHLSFLNPIDPSKIKIDISKFEYIIFVQWNRFMNKQSKHLIKIVQGNSKLAKGKSIKIIYVNNDGFFASNLEKIQ
jgi:hypothetical protein